MGVCDRHGDLISRIEDHEKRLGNLEISNAKTGEKIQNLIEKIDSLMTWIKALVMMASTSLVGFFFWYIQNIKG